MYHCPKNNARNIMIICSFSPKLSISDTTLNRNGIRKYKTAHRLSSPLKSCSANDENRHSASDSFIPVKKVRESKAQNTTLNLESKYELYTSRVRAAVSKIRKNLVFVLRRIVISINYFSVFPGTVKTSVKFSTSEYSLTSTDRVRRSLLRVTLSILPIGILGKGNDGLTIKISSPCFNGAS